MSILVDFHTLQQADDFNFALGGFLDEFRRMPKQGALEFLSEPSLEFLNESEKIIFVAVLHALFDEALLALPEWITQSKFVAKAPCYAIKIRDPKYCEYLQNTTPKNISCHNVFLGENPLRRV